MVVDLLSWRQVMLLIGSDIICKPLIGLMFPLKHLALGHCEYVCMTFCDNPCMSLKVVNVEKWSILTLKVLNF